MDGNECHVDHYDGGSTAFPENISSDTGDRKACDRGYPVPCCHVHDFVGAILFPAKYTSGSRRCDLDHGDCDRFHVDIPDYYGLYFQLCIPSGSDGHLDCDDDRLDFPWNLLFAAVSGAQVGDNDAETGKETDIEVTRLF